MFLTISQVLANVPTISIDKTDGCQMYLCETSMNVEIISSKSSEMNVLIPKGNGDYVNFKSQLHNDRMKIITFFLLLFRPKSLYRNNIKQQLMAMH